ncbi:MAG: Fic family protein [bacterium]|nr:Fic family protein [Gammaproteobacteria bacterium]HIL96893.1 Fic family protein [Pseudomonadales bacterium]
MRVPVLPPSLHEVFANEEKNEEKQEVMMRIFELISTDVGKDRGSEYLHWDRMRYKALPEMVRDHKEWWYITKFRRASSYRKLPFEARSGENFVYWIPDPLQQRLHEVDQQASGRVQIAEQVTNPSTRDRYLVNSLIEEAITSSQLEGASTTHKVAKAMLRESRHPRSRSEKMIFNNYQAMSFIREVTDAPLSKELLLELHKIVTDQTLDDPGAVGRFRTSEETIAVYDERDNTLLHDPPAAEELTDRIEKLCQFANAPEKDGEFLHPVIRSIILHFMIGYDHPFVDGNGRTARALFYWSMARHGYWMMEYISISSILRNGPAKYARSYLYSENDANDTTYFLDFNLKVILRAIKKLQSYLGRKTTEIRRVEQILGSTLFSTHLNHRQIALLSHALRNPIGTYSIESHRKSHSISYPTARSDLLHLMEIELLTQRKIGKAYIFAAVEHFEAKLEEIGKQIHRKDV